jgi:hypothetical protein
MLDPLNLHLKEKEKLKQTKQLNIINCDSFAISGKEDFQFVHGK